MFLPLLASAMTCNELQIVSITQTPTGCNNNIATAVINIAATSGNYSYQWTDLSDNSLLSQTIGTNQVQDDISNLGAGYYQIVVEDLDNNCSETAYFSIENQDAAKVDIVHVAAPSNCETNDGFVLFNADSEDVEITIIDLQNTNKKLTGDFPNSTIAGLSSGEYILQIKNNGDCSNFYFFEVPIGEPNFEISAGISKPNCNANNGIITLNVTNDSGNAITYNWLNPSGNPMNPANPLQIPGLSAGIYTLNASSGMGCEKQYQFKIESNTTMRIDVTTILDVRCTADGNGSFDFRMIDGSAPYTYSIPELGIVDKEINSATTTVDGLSRGTYTLQVTDNSKCSVITSIEVIEPTYFELDFIGTKEVAYCDATDGEICFYLTGGTPPYRISDDNNDFGVFEASNQAHCISNLAADTYNLNIIDDSGCMVSVPSIVVAAPDDCTCCNNFRMLSSSETNTNCGSTNGISSITLDGGSGNYTVTWHNALTNVIVTDKSSSQALISATSMGPGSYYAIAEDSDCNCMPLRHDFNINESDAATVNIIFENMTLLCADENRASFEFEVVGGNEPFTYQILGSDIIGTVTDIRSTLIDNLPVGEYVVEVTDFFGCKGYSTLVNTVAPEPIVIDAEVFNIAQCNDNQAGSIGLNITGGTPPYRITDANNDYGFFNAGQAYIRDLTTGTYSFDITDDNGCAVNMGALTITSTFNCANCNCAAFDLQNISSTPESCVGNDGSLDLNLSNGVGPFTYTLRKDGNTLIQYQTTANIFTFNGLPAGNYDIDVVDANCNCEILNETSSIGSSGIEATSAQTDIDCNTPTGEICLIILGGNAPYTVNNGTSDIGSFAEATEQCISDLTAGTYNYTITDEDGCSTVKTFNIQSSDVQIEVDRILLNATQGNSDGEFCLTITGGAAPYQVTDNSTDYGNFSEASTQCVSDVPAATYTLTITDANGCTTTETFTIEEEIVVSSIEAVVNSTTDASCSGNDGAFCVTISGGIAPYTLTDGDLSISDIAESTENCTNNLTANTYNFTVSDSNGNTASQTLAITITQADGSINVSPTTTGETCVGGDGSFCVTISGGTAPYSVTDGTTDFGTFEENAEKCVSNLSSGIYSLIISDANACTTAESVTIGLEGNNVAVIPEVSDASCGNSDGEICLTISGGSAPYSVSDTNNNYGDFDENTQACIPGLGEGTYELNIADANGCQKTETVTVNTSTANNSIAITANATSGCSDNSGQICLTISGGMAPYAISDESTNYGDLAEATEQCFSSLAAGAYNFSVTDANGCTAIETATINQGAANNIAITVDSKSSCNGALTCVIIEGGNAPYNLLIDTKTYGPFGEGTENCFNALSNGFHNLVATDNTGCTKAKTVLISNPSGGGDTNITATINTIPASCNGVNTGSVCLTISGGVAPYSVRELDAVFPLEFLEATENCIDNLAARTYTFTITDSDGCSFEETVAVGDSAGNLSATVNTIPASCNSVNTGSVCLTISGGVAPYSVRELDAVFPLEFLEATENCIDNLAARTYTFTITDSEGCSFEEIATVGTTTANISAMVRTNPTTCEGNGNDGEICLIISGGTAPYIITDNNNQTYTNFENATEKCTASFAAGDYTLNITDSNGCTFTTSATVAAATDCGEKTPPVAVNDSFNFEGNDIHCFNVLKNDTQTEGDDLTLQNFSQPSQGKVALGTSVGELCYTPPTDFEGVVSFTYTVCDDDGCVDGTVSLTITQDNTPCENPSGLCTGIMTPINFCVEFCELEGVIEIEDVQTTFDCGITTEGLCVKYVPLPGFIEMQDILQVIGCNSQGVCDTVFVDIYVGDCSNVNQAPDAVNDSANSVGSPVSINVLQNDSDPDGDPINITEFTQPTNGTVTQVGTELVYTPNPGFEGNDTFTYTICDDSGACDTATVTVSVELPCVNPDDLCTGLMTPIEICVEFCNVEGIDEVDDVITLFDCGINTEGLCVTYTPLPGFIDMTEHLQIIGCNALGVCDTVFVDIYVGDCSSVNKPPIANNDFAVTTENMAIPIAVLVNDSDPDGDPITITEFTQGANGTVKIDGNTLVYTPNTDFVGEDTFTYTICDDSSECDTATVTVQVNELNSNLPPIAVDDTAETDENVPVTINVTANDSDPNGDTFTITGFTSPANGTVALVGGALVYTPNAGFSGTDTFTYQICDNGGLCDEATVTVTVNDNCSEFGQFICAEPLQTIEICPVFCDLPGEELHIISAHSTFECGTDIPENSLCFDYTPLPGFNLTDSIEIIACTMDSLLCDTVIFYVFSGCSNPIAFDDTATTPNNQTATIDVLANDWGVNCIEELDMNIISNPSNGIAMVNQNNEVVYTPNPNFVGVDVLQYQLCDLCGDNKCDEATVTITVTDGGGDPIVIAQPDVVQTPFGISIDIDVLANDTGNNLQITNVTPASNGTAAINPGGGSIIYEPNAGYSGTDYFFYTICDPTGVFCSTTIVSVTVLPENTPNQPPTANDDTATTPVNVAVTIPVLANDSDPENAPLSLISITEQPTNGLVTIVGSQVVYTPFPGFEGTDVFVYVACDPGGLCDQATVTVAVGEGGIPNNPPVANPDEVSTPLNTPITIGVLANDSDPDGDNLTVTLGSDPMNGIAAVSPDGSIIYTPQTGFEGVDYLTYILCDDGSPILCDTTYVTINVTNDGGGEDPIVIAAPDVVQTPFNISINIDVLANDTGENLVITNATQGENGIVAIASDGGSIVYQPNAGFSGTDYFFYTICDPTGVFCDSTIVSVTVLPQNNANLPPNANNDIVVTPQNTPITIDVLANDSDPEGAPLTVVSISNQPTNGTAEIVSGEVVYTPNPDFVGVDSFTYIVCDPQGLCDEATVGIAVGLEEFPNNPPIAVEDVANTTTNTPVTIPVLANDSDPDGDDLTVTLGSDPMHGTASVDENGNINYTPEAGFEGTDFLTYILCDDGQPVLCDTTFVTITVEADNGENQPPIAVDDTGSTLIGTPVDILVLNNDSDPDGDNIVITAILTQPANGSALIGMDTASITYLPNAGFIGTDCFEYQICDPEGLCDVATVCVTVQPPADANPDVAFTPINTPVAIAVLVNDLGVELTITGFTQPENGSVALNPDNTFTYTPNTGFTGDDYFTYQICDVFGNCDETVVAVNVYDGEITGNHPPTANNDTAETPINTPVTVPVLDNDSDPDGDPLTVTDLLDIPVGVGLEITDDGTTVTVTPDPDFEGCVVFSYIVCDSFNACDTAQVGVAVGDVDCLNNAPIAVDDDFTTPQGTAISFDVLENDSDPDGDNLTAAPITEPANGTLLQEEDGTFTYIPNADFIGTDYFLYTACDDGTTPPLCDTAVVTIVVQPSEVEPIVANPDIVQTAVNTPIDIPVLDNDEGAGLTVSGIVTDPENGTATTDGTTVIYTPDTDFVGTDYFIYEACNATGQCDTTLVTVIVLPDSVTNIAPVAVNDVATTPVSTPVQIAVLLNDFDPFGGDTLVITTFTVPTNGTTIFDANGVFTYTPDPDFIGIDSFTYTICDNGTPILCDVGTVVINVGSDELPNNPPIAVDDEVTTPPNTPISIPILGNDSDPDGDNLVVTFVSIPIHGTAELVGDEVLYTPDSTYLGDDFFSYIICDDGQPVLCDTAYVTIHIMDEIVDNTINITVTENSDNVICLDSLIALGILTLDFIPDSLNITSLPSNGIATPSDTSLICFNYAPDTDFTGTDQLILEVCEGTVCETVTVNINVIPLDGIVVIAEDDAVTTDLNTPIDIPVLGNDAYPTDGSGVVDLIIIDLPSNGTVVVNGDILGDTTITYTPNIDFAGVDSFRYALCYTFPDTAICDTALVIITIDSENNGCDLKFANAFSPNGDNINDLFLIENADNLEECFETIGELVIFNRWGDEVYRVDGYDNSVAWDGTWQNNGKDVPDGTYFYVLRYIVDTRPVAQNGFVEVCR
ncbi:MAG: Ig-like domain-containing protein [Chitinophagales bacterium]